MHARGRMGGEGFMLAVSLSKKPPHALSASAANGWGPAALGAPVTSPGATSMALPGARTWLTRLSDPPTRPAACRKGE